MQNARELQAAGVAAVTRIADALERPELERRREDLQRAVAPGFKRPFAGSGGAILLLRSIPGFAALWERKVPESHLLRTCDREDSAATVVLCPCGAQSPIDAGEVLDCGCGRWFFHVGSSIRVKRFVAEDGDALAA